MSMQRPLRLAIAVSLFISVACGTSALVPSAHALAMPQDLSFPDCVNASDEFCVEEFGFTAEGSTSETIYADAVPASSSSQSHPNPYLRIYSTGMLRSVYGKQVSSIDFEIIDTASINLGSVTRTGIPSGTYRIVLRTGEYKPHSMTIKGKPGLAEPFKVMSEQDGTYKWQLTAVAAPFVTLMDTTKWNACRSEIPQDACSADTAFVNTLFGILLLATPGFVDTSSPVSPELKMSQGLWVASNTIVRDVLPEMNLVKKFLHLPAYGPHFVPSDFPTTGLTAENGRYLNPAYFEAFVPTALAAFMAEFEATQVQEKLASSVKTTIEKNGVEIENAHSIEVAPIGGRVSVQISHYSAPNPRVYVGAVATGTPSTTSGSSSSTSTSATQVSSNLSVGKSMSLSTVAKSKGLVVVAGSKVAATVISASKKICKVRGTKVVAISKGNCRLSITVTPKKGKKKSKTVTLPVIS